MAKMVKRRGGAPSPAVRRACFLEVLRQTGNVSRAAREAGLSSTSVYRYRKQLPKFAADWDAVMNESLDVLEATLFERARTGVAKDVWYRGEIVGSTRTYSDALAMFLLKAHRPEVYDRLAGSQRSGNVRTLSEADAKGEVLRRLDRIAAREIADGLGVTIDNDADDGA